MLLLVVGPLARRSLGFMLIARFARSVGTRQERRGNSGRKEECPNCGQRRLYNLEGAERQTQSASIHSITVFPERPFNHGGREGQNGSEKSSLPHHTLWAKLQLIDTIADEYTFGSRSLQKSWLSCGCLVRHSLVAGLAGDVFRSKSFFDFPLCYLSRGTRRFFVGNERDASTTYGVHCRRNGWRHLTGGRGP